MKSRTVPAILALCAVAIVAEAGYIGYKNRDMLTARSQDVQAQISSQWVDITEDAGWAAVSFKKDAKEKYDEIKARAGEKIHSVFALEWLDLPAINVPDIEPEISKLTYRFKQEEAKQALDETPLYLKDFAEIQPAADAAPAQDNPAPAPAMGGEQIEVEAVLVPQQITVVSSSRDGRIKTIHVDNGDTFRKGDLLIEYDCDDLMAESDIVAAEKSLADKRTEGTEKLFKLDLISDIEKIDTETKTRQVDARVRLYQSRMQQCNIYAGFDGRVTNRLANANEYTRTDRVLMEIASADPLRAEFLIPSKWLRWVNVGAPIEIMLNETDKSYAARVSRIYGEVDPVSQSIQIVATMDDYTDPLLPGMSGQATLNTQRIREAGVTGYLDTAAKP